MGKRELERGHLELFLDAFARATGQTFSNVMESETPDFIANDNKGRRVGIEMTSLRLSPEMRHLRSISPTQAGDSDAWCRLLTIMVKKQRTLLKGHWPGCTRKILVIMMVDATIENAAGGAETRLPERDGFDEVWLAEYSQADVFGAVDLFAVVHSQLQGRLATGDEGQKPYG